ncbi:hypothetical protein D3C71_1609680 [compost metagenome]
MHRGIGVRAAKRHAIDTGKAREAVRQGLDRMDQQRAALAVAYDRHGRFRDRIGHAQQIALIGDPAIERCR